MTSSRMRSGGCFDTCSRAIRPSVAESMIYPRASSLARRSSTLSALSSTTRIRAGWSGPIVVLATEEALYLGNHGAWLAGLCEVAVTAHLHRLFPIRREGMRGQRNDGNVLRGRIVLQHLRRFPSIDDRDGDI